MTTHQPDSEMPFSGARAFLRTLKLDQATRAALALYLRPITHVTPVQRLSLSDSQTPFAQLRFYTRERVYRGWRYVGRVLAAATESSAVHVAGPRSSADDEFFAQLRLGGLEVDLRGGRCDADDATRRDETSFLAQRDRIRAGRIDPQSLAEMIDELLCLGDSWTAAALAREFDRGQRPASAELATSMALAYALQGDNDNAERLFRVWEGAGGLESARARYSLAMLYARHHDKARLDASIAEQMLEAGYRTLLELPQSPAVVYESVFNRNGFALLLFRRGDLSTAAQLLESGIARLAGTEWSGKLHETVLLNNLGRVYAAMGDDPNATRCLEEAVQLDPLFAEYRQDLASWHADCGRHSLAVREIRRAIELDPAIAEAHCLLGFLHESQGDAASACGSYSTALGLGSPPAGLALLRALSSLDRYPDVLQHLPAVAALTVEENDVVETRLLELEARSFTERIDLVAGLKRLHEQYPTSELVQENLALAGAGAA